MFCPNCGTQLPDEAHFCSSCGAQIGTPEPTPESAPAPEPEPITIEPVAPEPAPSFEPPTTQLDPQPTEQFAQPSEPEVRPTEQFARPYQQPIYSEPYDPVVPVPEQKKSKTPLIIAIVAAVAVLGVAIAGMATNWFGLNNGTFGLSEEELIRREIASSLETISNPTEEQIREALGADTIAELEAYGIDLVSVMQRVYTYFSFDVGSVTVDGDKAKAELIMTFPDVEALQDELAAKMESELKPEDLLSSYLSGSIGGLMDQVLDTMFGVFDENPTVRKSTTIPLTLTRTKDGWQMDEIDSNEISEQVMEDLMGGLSELEGMA